MTMRHKGCAILLAAALLLGIAAAADSALATVSPPEAVASSLPDTELSRLHAVRERLTRRRSLERALDQRAAGLDREIDGLRAAGERARMALHSERDRVQALERRLDQLVPRILAKSAAVRERRQQAARLLAELASTSRQVQLDPTIRARILAISPLMLQRLQGAESGLAALERRPDRLRARQQEIERRVPLLAAEEQRLQQQREQRKRQRQVVIARLGQVSAEVQQLSREQQLLARRALDREVARAVPAAPRADQPALPGVAARSAGDGALDAVVRGLLAERPRAFSVHAVQPASARLVAVAPKSLLVSELDAATFAQLAAGSPPPAKPLDAALKGELGSVAALTAATERMSPLDAVFLAPAPLAEIPSRVAPARLPEPLVPIMPIPGEAVSPFAEARDDDPGQGITIVAAPGQAVAAPEDGRVAFAGPFKSYGLLLIIEHQREYHTLLWGFSELDVALGDRVRTGQVVGVMAADTRRPARLHVELRRNGRPVNFFPWLAASSNKVRG